MVGSEGALEDRQGAPVESVRLGISPLSFVEHRQVVGGHGDVRVRRAQQLLLEGEGALIERFGFSGVAGGLTNRGKVVQVDGNLVMLRPMDALEDREGPSDEPLGLFAFALTVQNRGQGGRVGRDVRMLGAEPPLANLQRSSRVRLAHRVASAGMLEPAEVVVERGGVDGVFVVRGEDERDCAAIDPLGFVESAELLVQHSEIVERGGRLDVVRPERALHEPEGAREELLGPLVLATSLGPARETIEDTGDESSDRPAGIAGPAQSAG